MAYQRRYLQQTQSRTYSAGTSGTPDTVQRNYTWINAVGNWNTPYRDQVVRLGQSYPTLKSLVASGWGRISGNTLQYKVYDDVTTPGTPGTPGTQQTARLRRGETASGDLRLSMAQGKRALRIEPTELGQLPGRDLPPPGANSYDPFTASEAEGLAGLRRRRSPQIDLSINASDAATGLNTL